MRHPGGLHCRAGRWNAKKDNSEKLLEQENFKFLRVSGEKPEKSRFFVGHFTTLFLFY